MMSSFVFLADSEAVLALDDGFEAEEERRRVVVADEEEDDDLLRGGIFSQVKTNETKVSTLIKII